MPAVLAATGYDEGQLALIKKCSEKIAVFKTANFSLGVNLLVKLVREAAEALGENFDIEITERHHNQKADAPSGTALMLAEDNFVKIFNGDMIVMTMPLSILIFIMFVGMPVSAPLAFAGKTYATGIYIFHLAVMGVVKHIDGLEMHPALSVVTFALTLSILVAWRAISRTLTIKRAQTA